jgi:hypothetical protein
VGLAAAAVADAIAGVKARLGCQTKRGRAQRARVIQARKVQAATVGEVDGRRVGGRVNPLRDRIVFDGPWGGVRVELRIY